MIFGGPGLRSSQSPGGALDRQRGRRSRAGASLLRPQRRGESLIPPRLAVSYRTPMILRAMSTPMTLAIIRPRVQPEESPRQYRFRMLVRSSSSMFTRLE